MQQFFNLMHRIALTKDKEYDSIKELTIDVAMSGGYNRKLTLVGKNDKKWAIRTSYNMPATWDNALVAKWYCHYEKLFRYKLLQHPELKEYHLFIIERTFQIAMNSLDIDKLVCDAVINKIVNMSLACRIGEALGMIGSEERMKEARAIKESGDRTKKKRIQYKYAMNHMARSLDAMVENKTLEKNATVDLSYIDIESDAYVQDLKSRLKDNEIGLRLLDSMLYSDKKINLSKIDHYVDIRKSEKNDSTLSNLKSAWNTIIEYMKDTSVADGTYGYADASAKFDCKFKDKFKYAPTPLYTKDNTTCLEME